jgi:hypothetical protein
VRFWYYVYGLIVIIVTMLVNLADTGSGASRGFGSSGWGSGSSWGGGSSK